MDATFFRKAFVLIFDYQSRKGDSEGGASGTAAAILAICLFLNLGTILCFLENFARFSLATKVLDWLTLSKYGGFILLLAYLTTCVVFTIYCESKGRVELIREHFNADHVSREKAKRLVLSYLVSSPILLFIVVVTYIM